MAKVASFEELVAWQKARKLCSEIYALTSRPPFDDRGLKRQGTPSRSTCALEHCGGAGRDPAVQLLG